MGTVLLLQGVNPFAVNKYIITYIKSIYELFAYLCSERSVSPLQKQAS
jgi:hypothetical protein